MSKHYTLEELIADESFIDWIRNGRPRESYWYNEYLNNESVKAHTAEASRLINSILIRKERITPERLQRLKESIDRKIESRSLYVHQSKSFKITWYKKFSIAAALVLTILYVTYQSTDVDEILAVEDTIVENTSSEYITKSTASGEKHTIQLTDGTVVKLNSNSEIRYSKTFSDTTRVVELTGEAFFEVKQDVHRPFIVISNTIEIKALGTSFNVRLTGKQKDVNVTLATGKVEVSNSASESKQKVYLSPSQQVVYKSSKGEFSDVKQVNLGVALAWKDGRIVFDRAESIEVFSYLSEWYGIAIYQMDANNQKWEYSGEFEGESLENVLSSIGYVEGFNYVIKKDSVLIYND